MDLMIRILMLLMIVALITAQEFTINGYVKDITNSEDLIAVNIYVEGELIGTTTNEYGYYSLTLNRGNYVLIYDYVGYQKERKEINLIADLTINVELKPDVQGEDESNI